MRRAFIFLAISVILAAMPAETPARRVRIDPGKPAGIREAVAQGRAVPGSRRMEWAHDDLQAPLFKGYDKTLGADVETFYIVNRADRPLTGLDMDIVYYSMDSGQLHRRRLSLSCDIAPGETRQFNVRSWDRQHSFYYHRSAPPRRDGARPYRITVEPVAYFLRKK